MNDIATQLARARAELDALREALRRIAIMTPTQAALEASAVALACVGGCRHDDPR